MTSEGNIVKITIPIASKPTYGMEPLIISFVGMSGAIPFTTKILSPTGGVIKPISIFNVITIPNQMGSNPRPVMIGNKIGVVIKIIAAGGIKNPNIIKNKLIMINTSHFDMSRLVI